MIRHHQPPLFSGRGFSRRWVFGDLEPMSFGLIMADPAWRFELFSDKGETKGAESHYDTMTLADICKLPVGALASENSLLWLWVTAPMLPQGLEVMKAWGFAYCTMGAWHKKTELGKTSFGYGYRLRSACEPFLIGTSGRPETTHSVRNLVEGLAREHSRKPDEAYAACEALMPSARKLDLFSREDRPGWESWGNEQGLFNGRVDVLNRRKSLIGTASHADLFTHPQRAPIASGGTGTTPTGESRADDRALANTRGGTQQ